MLISIQKGIKSFAVIILALALNLSFAFAQQQSAPHSWTVQDSVERLLFDDDMFGFQVATPILSPSATRFGVVTQHGDLECDCTRFALSIYNVEDVRKAIAEKRTAPKPYRIINMASNMQAIYDGGEAIRDIVWKDDDNLLFYGTGEMGHNYSVFDFSLKNNKLKRLTDPSHNVFDFDIRGDTIIYVARRIIRRERDEQGWIEGINDYPIQPLRGVGISGELVPQMSPTDWNVFQMGVFTSSGNKSVREILPFRTTPYPFTRPPNNLNWVAPRLSPDGRFAAIGVPIEGDEIPEAWQHYQGLEAPSAKYLQMFKPTRPVFYSGRLQRVALVDMKSGKIHPLWDAPIGPIEGGANGAAFYWSKDSEHLLVHNAMLPITADTPERRSQAYLVDYAVKTKRLEVLEPLKAPMSAETLSHKAEMNKEKVEAAPAEDDVALSEIVVRITPLDEGGGSDRYLVERADLNLARPRPHNSKTIYALESGRWTATPTAMNPPPGEKTPKLPDGFFLSYEENMTLPPKLIASDGDRKLTLIDSANVLQGVSLRRPEAVTWPVGDGSEGKGSLILPEGEGPFPLVVQFDYDGPEKFRPEGHSRAGYSAQALAAQGIAVLDMDVLVLKEVNGQHVALSRIEALARLRNRLDAAVLHLAGRGLVDKNRVGLIGFSYTGGVVSYLITHPGKVTPRAAGINDSSLRIYSEQLVAGAMTQTVLDDEGDNYVVSSPNSANDGWNGSFFEEEGRQRWLEHAPMFNVHRTETAALFVYQNLPLPFLNEAVGAYRLNKREMDIYLIPNGEHQLTRPRQWEASMNVNIEWMTFWLQDRVIAPEKEEQYWYWNKLKEQRDKRWAKEGSPYDKPANDNATAPQLKKAQ